MKRIKYSEIPKLRRELLLHQGNKCPICGKNIQDGVLDHQHRNNKNEPIGLNGAGMIRGVLCRECNCIEGKITNALKRFQKIQTTPERIEFLKKLIEYYQMPLTDYVHPSEREPIKHVSKRQYNKLKKVYSDKAKFPEYPKSGKLTAKLQILFNKYHINPYT